VTERKCVMCGGEVEVTDVSDRDDRGGYVPLTFTGEPTIEVWVHCRCLLTSPRNQVAEGTTNA
jgi:hypothetical protein